MNFIVDLKKEIVRRHENAVKEPLKCQKRMKH